MTPHQADVAFVLESVSGVTAVYAVAPGSQAAAGFDFAIKLEHGEGAVVAAHYALLRVLTHDECARVFHCRLDMPSVVAQAARPLVLTASEREAARARVAAAPAREAIAVAPRKREPNVLIVDDDPDVVQAVRDVLVGAWGVSAPARWALFSDVDAAAKLARGGDFELILCESGRAFGKEGLLAKLPLEMAQRVLVLATPSDALLARSRLQGTDRILTKPLEGWVLRDRMMRATTMDLLSVPDMARVVRAEPPRRTLTAPPASAPFSVLLVDLDDDVHEALRGIFREDARHMMRRDPEEAAELALSTPFHVIACSANAALHPRSFLRALAREDADGADRVLVLAPSRDVPYVKHKLGLQRRTNTVLALPIDDTILRHEVFRDHPELAARLALAAVAETHAAPVDRPKFRRLGVLVVDDDVTTEILFAAAGPHEDADVALASTTMGAFEHVLARPVDLLVVSSTMRGDGGEPFYRVLWRLKPELKRRTVLITPADLAPLSAPQSTLPRVVERPLTRDAIARITTAFAQPP
jgi:hypothetical protein